jgi:ribosomal protein S18 acetylase RimI-like enzyme
MTASTPLLGGQIADLYTVIEAGPDDAEEVYSLVSAAMTAVLGYSPLTREDLASWLDIPERASGRNLLVRDAAGATAQFWGGFRMPGANDFDAGVRTHPDVPADHADVLSARGFDVLLDWARSVAADEPEGRSVPNVYARCLTLEHDVQARIERAGFVHERTWWSMAGPVSKAALPSAVEGLRVEATADPETVHALLTETFADHWGIEELAFDDWITLERSEPGFDPDLWYLASVDDVPAAAMIMSRRSEANGALYVQELGTLERFRRRGIASVLLRCAFDVARDNGADRLELLVDSDNPQHAPAVYERAGLTMRHGYNVFRRPLHSDPPR